MAPMDPTHDDTPAEGSTGAEHGPADTPDTDATADTDAPAEQPARASRTRKATAKSAGAAKATSTRKTAAGTRKAATGTRKAAAPRKRAAKSVAEPGDSAVGAEVAPEAAQAAEAPAAEAPAAAPVVPAADDSTSGAVQDAPQESPAEEPARPARRRATRGTATLFSHQEEAVATRPGEVAPDAAAEVPAEALDDQTDAAAESPGAPAAAFGLLFQAPDLSAARPARKRAEARTPAPADEPAGGGKSADRPQEPTDAADRPEDGERGVGDESPDESEDAEGARRRRRRGGKGRRGRGGSDEQRQDGDEPGAEEKPGERPAGADEADQAERPSRTRRRSRGGDGDAADGAGRRGGRDQAAQQATADEDEDGDSGTRRRRRRRRSGEEGDRREEVTGVKGSTRLEAKRQRRREGREAGRRRTVITEAEFLARRESVERVMVVRGLEDRTQIGVLEDGVLVEHYVSRETQSTMVGNVYLGRVQNVLPSMEAAFVDIGKGRNAVLYAGEVNWDAAGLDNEPKRIENALSSGEAVLVQVTKDPIGHKGARLTSQVSLPGRYLVYVPGNSMTGISRKLPDTERTRLKKILKDVVPADAGVIVRTAAEGASEAELRADVERLTATWERIQSKQGSANAPALLHGEADMTVRVIRDVFNEDFTRLVVSGDKAWKEISDYVSGVAPDLADRLERWDDAQDIFTAHRVTEALAKAMDRKVWLPSGGSLVIDRTEAMTVVDVNTGKFVGSGGNLEETVTKNNIEAAEEIVRQLRLRDIGGIIVIDFIDMVLESNRDLVVRRLLECLGRDRTKHQVAEVTSLGLVQMTRKRVGSGLIEVFSEPCAHCSGRGIMVHSEPVEKTNGESGNGGSRGAARGGSRKSRSGSSAASSTPAAVLPPPNPNGPTPAQIAAAAHAAAIQAVAAGDAGPAAAEDGPQAPETAQDTAAESAAAALSDQEAPEQGSAEQVASAEQAAPTPAPVLDQPAEPTGQGRARRRRGRVVAPAGPPGSTTVAEAE